mgnify:CR=1 FL=1
MARGYAEIAFTDAVKALQTARGSRDAYARREGGGEAEALGPAEVQFLVSRRSFYMATVSETGWPYVQHRGGPAGFLEALGPRRIGFADAAGNRQHVSLGNLAGEPRVSLFLMDYANRRRLKIFGRAEVSDDPFTLERLAVPGWAARIERAILIEVAAFDWNCPQRIPELYGLEDVRAATAGLTARIAALEAELATLRGGAAG